MPAGSGRGGIRVDADQYAQVRARAREFDPLLDKELKKALRQGAKIGADAAKAKIRTMPSYGTHRAGHGSSSRPQHLRAKLASNIRVVVSNRDVRIVQSVIGIRGANAKGLPRRLDEGGRFRHPVFGRSDDWASQLGYAYFSRTIAAKRPEIEAGVKDAMDRAIRVMEG
jgi:hypothetical protein